jgi:peptidylprolyl isomerase
VNPGGVRRIAALGLAWLVLACGPGGPAPPGPEDVTFAPELAVDLEAMERTSSGLYLLDLEEGAGPPAQRTSLVTVHYVGWLPDGTVVDSSLGGEPFQFRLGGSEVIRGWNQGIPGMKRGGRRRLVVRPGLAYGSRGSARVPPGASLVFEVRLVDVR